MVDRLKIAPKQTQLFRWRRPYYLVQTWCLYKWNDPIAQTPFTHERTVGPSTSTTPILCDLRQRRRHVHVVYAQFIIVAKRCEKWQPLILNERTSNLCSALH